MELPPPLVPHYLHPDVEARYKGTQTRSKRGGRFQSRGDFLKDLGQLPCLDGYPVGNLRKEDARTVQQALYIAANYFRITGRRFPLKTSLKRSYQSWLYLVDRHVCEIGPRRFSFYGLSLKEAEAFHNAAIGPNTRRESDPHRVAKKRRRRD